MANGDPIAYVESPVLIRIMNKGALAVGAGWAYRGCIPIYCILAHIGLYWPVLAYVYRIHMLDQMQMYHIGEHDSGKNYIGKI